MSRTGVSLSAIVFTLLAGAAGAQGSSPPQEHVRGDVVALRGDTLEVKTRAGQDLTLKLADDARVALAEKADLSAIGQGGFIGTTAVPQPDGTLRAVEVHVFAEAMRGTGEGHRPWDLQPGSTMTNATVAKVHSGGRRQARSTMTNATVAKVADSAGGRTLDLEYRDGAKKVVVPAGTPVVKLEPGDRSQLKPGAHLFAIVTRQPDGTLVAQRMTVGKDGLVPPM